MNHTEMLKLAAKAVALKVTGINEDHNGAVTMRSAGGVTIAQFYHMPGTDPKQTMETAVMFMQLHGLVRSPEFASLVKDAERYRWLRDQKFNALHLDRNGGHACNYVSAKEWIEESSPEWFEETDPAELERMKESNTIWGVQIYPTTPVGFYKFNGATLDYVLDAAIDAELKP